MPASIRYGVQPSGGAEPEPKPRGWDFSLRAVLPPCRLKPELHACFGGTDRHATVGAALCGRPSMLYPPSSILRFLCDSVAKRVSRGRDLAVLDATSRGYEGLIRLERLESELLHPGFAVGSGELVAQAAVLING